MSNEVTTPAARPLDEFDTYVDTVAGDDEQTSERVIQGQHLRFTNEGNWQLRDGDTPFTKKLVAANVRRCLTRWGSDNKPVKEETRFLAPGELIPDVEALNENVPRSQWRIGPSGQPQGPYVVQRIVYFVDPVSLDKYTYPTSTIGGSIAVDELVDRVKWLRRFRSHTTYPLVQFAKRPMKTRFGIRPRPHFEVVQWIMLNPSSGMIPTDDPRQLPPAKPAETPGKPEEASTTPETPGKPLDAVPLKTVSEPSTSEALNDRIPF